MEKRFQVTEVRAKKNGDKRTITGYAARHNVLSGDLGGFRERIASGAFKRILATKPDVVCLFNHSDNAVLGRTTAGTLRLSEDSRGLKFECDLPDLRSKLATISNSPGTGSRRGWNLAESVSSGLKPHEAFFCGG